MDLRFFSRAVSRRVLDLYLLYIGAATLFFSVHYMRMKSAWIYGSWLISYAGGFVRRGATGEVLLAITRVTHLPLFYATALLHLACLLVFGLSLRRLCLRSSWHGWIWFLIFSPVTLAFVIFDSSVAFRQEILFFALLGVLIPILDEWRLRDATLAFFLSITVPFLILSHEGLVCYLPYLAAALLIGLGSLRRTIKVALLPALLAGISLGVAMTHTGTDNVAHAVCEALGNPHELLLSGVCDGSISALGMTPDLYRAEVTGMLHNKRAMIEFGITSVLAILPTFYGFADIRRRKGERRSLWIFGGAALISLFASGILFATALDWVRWIYIHIVCLAFLLIWIDTRTDAGDTATQDSGEQASMNWKKFFALALYGVVWNIPYYPVLGAFGYGSLFKRIWTHGN